jgi:hypothetical protein
MKSDARFFATDADAWHAMDVAQLRHAPARLVMFSQNFDDRTCARIHVPVTRPITCSALQPTREVVMGILDTLGEVAGAVAAVEGAEKLDPNAGLLTKGLAAVAGFKGAGALESALGKKKEGEAESNEADAAPADDSQS